ncbi:Glyoxylate/hydroxypyruvate reductase B [Coccomyxa sp. Obi]|nr:Glyoxylate/hydroxypyruvate reductase B [Coccomyxa sp. Obi]
MGHLRDNSDTSLPLMVGLGVAGVRYLEGNLPEGVELVPISPSGPLPDNLPQIEFMITSGVEFSVQRLQDIFETAKGIKVVQTLSAGVNNVVSHVKPGVTLCNASGSHDVAVAEWCVGVILALLRQFPAFWNAQQNGEWNAATRELITTGMPAIGSLDDLEDKEVLILGHGSIGRALEERLRPFGARITGVARSTRPGVRSLSEVDNLLPEADIVVILLPLTPETHHIVDVRFLARMKRGALLINAGRGPQVDTDALVKALHEGHIRAALDVTDPEPLPPGHPLWQAPGVVITPHIGGSVARMRIRGYAFVLKQIKRYLAGEKLENVRLHGY